MRPDATCRRCHPLHPDVVIVRAVLALGTFLGAVWGVLTMDEAGQGDGP